LAGLVRTQVGDFHLEESHSVQEVLDALSA
jgi:hypothetical protein